MRRILFEKKGNAIWISHLDLMRVMQRSFRRAGLLLKHSQGFTPRAFVSMLLPLPVGMSSNCELMDFDLDESDKTENSTIKSLLSPVLPEGIRVLEVYDSDRKPVKLVYLQAAVTLEYDRGVQEGAEKAINRLLEQPELIVEKRTKKGMAETDIRPMIKSAKARKCDDNTVVIDTVVTAQNPSLNPMLLSEAVKRYLPAYCFDFASCCRLEVLDEDLQQYR